MSKIKAIILAAIKYGYNPPARVRNLIVSVALDLGADEYVDQLYDALNSGADYQRKTDLLRSLYGLHIVTNRVYKNPLGSLDELGWFFKVFNNKNTTETDSIHQSDSIYFSHEEALADAVIMCEEIIKNQANERNSR